MRLFIIISIALLSYGKCFAQVSKIDWGPETEGGKRLYPDRFLGKDNRAIYFIQDTYNPFCPFCPSDHYLQKFDAETMSLIYSKELKMPAVAGKDNRHVRFEELFLLNGKLILFTSFFDKEERTNTAYVQTVGADGEVINDAKIMDKVQVMDKAERSEFSFALSSDSTKILEFKNDYTSHRKGAKQHFAYKVIDNSLNELWGNDKIELDYNNADFNVKDYVLDKSGNFYMLAEIENEKNTWFKDRPSYLYKILLIAPQSSEVKEYDVELENKTISDMSFRVNKNQDVIAAGFYSNRGKYADEIAGTFYVSIDGKTKDEKAKGLKDFDTRFLLNFMSERSAKRGSELRQFNIDQIIERADGGAYMVAEQRYVQTITTFNGRYSTTDYYYNFNDLIVAGINADGKINWVTMVPKTQVTANDKGPYSGYAMAVTGNTINFIFNDNTRNLAIANPREYKTFSGPKKSTCVLVTIGNNGELTKRPLFSEKEKKIFTRAKIYLQTSANELMMYAERGRKMKLFRVEFL